MGASLRIVRAGPLATLQDRGRYGALRYGISASGPMDRRAFAGAGRRAGNAGTAGIEFTAAGIDFEVVGASVRLGGEGGAFGLRHNGASCPWPASVDLAAGDRIEIVPGPAGNYGYLRFDREIAVAPVMGSRATNLIAGLGGYRGRALKAGDVLPLGPTGATRMPGARASEGNAEGPFRMTWGLHADLFTDAVRQRFLDEAFEISPRLDRMGVRLNDPEGVFSHINILSLVSDAIVPGDIQILGDGTPIVLMRDHQPTGGYPRIGTIVSSDLDRFAQLRAGTRLHFVPVTPTRARQFYLAEDRS